MSEQPGGPLLVTGMPRTATSWVGKMLEASGALVYVNEPLNPQHPPGRSSGVLGADVEHAFQYITEENERVWLPAFRDTVRLRFHLKKGKLYSFWVSADGDGASGGYVAAGGPGYTGPIDTVGRAALRQ